MSAATSPKVVSHSERATPSADAASSIAPYASVRASDFATRPPYQSEVVPSSPFFV